MNNHRLRAIILNLQDRLSNDDRKRLHFYLGNDVPRRIRDDPSLSGTLKLMDSLFDQDKINEQDFTFLIDAFDEIHCIDAVKLLREHLRQNRSNGLNQSIESLSLLMPPIVDQLLQDQDEDKLVTEPLLVNRQNICGDNNVMINSNNTHINQMSIIVSDQETLHSGSKRKQRLNSSSAFRKCLLLFILLSIVGYGVLTVFSVVNSIHIGQLRTKNSQSMELIQQLKHQLGQLEDRRSSAFKSNVHHNTTWIQNAFTVAGGNGQGNELNQFNNPYSIYINDDQTIYIADYKNHRIVEWKSGAINGQVVAGRNGQGSRMDQLNSPTDAVVDKEGNNLIICDHNNRRVVRWPLRNGTSGQIIAARIDCWGLTLDNNRNLYISDNEKHEVRQWKMNSGYRKLVAGGNGQGNSLDRLSSPTNIFVDDAHSIYVSDWDNGRVMKWMKGATEGTVVAGGQGEGKGLTQLAGPQGVIVDHLGTLYVAEYGNNRIMRWSKGAIQGNIVVGGNGQGKQANQLNCPEDLSFDQQGNLYVVDRGNHRIQRFDINRS